MHSSVFSFQMPACILNHFVIFCTVVAICHLAYQIAHDDLFFVPFVKKEASIISTRLLIMPPFKAVKVLLWWENSSYSLTRTASLCATAHHAISAWMSMSRDLIWLPFLCRVPPQHLPTSTCCGGGYQQQQRVRLRLPWQRSQHQPLHL